MAALDDMSIGPSDRAADIGLLGNPGPADVDAGILAQDNDLQTQCHLRNRATFIDTEIDVTLLARNTRATSKIEPSRLIH